MALLGSACTTVSPHNGVDSSATEKVPENRTAPSPVGSTPATAASADPRALRERLRQAGFAELIPASTLLGPGTVVVVKGDTAPAGDAVPAAGMFAGEILCTPATAFGSALQVAQSAAVSSQVAQRLGGSFSLDGSYLQLATAGAQAKAVRSIVFTLSDVEILELPRQQIFANLARRAPSCSNAVIDAVRHGERVSLIMSVLKATATYTVSFSADASLNASAKAEVVKGIAASLGLSGTKTNEATIAGVALYWGIRDDARFGTLAANGKDLLTNRGLEPQDTAATPVSVIPAGARMTWTVRERKAR
jgi:hypothetical protein